jgi:hypothetical protein
MPAAAKGVRIQDSGFRVQEAEKARFSSPEP